MVGGIATPVEVPKSSFQGGYGGAGFSNFSSVYLWDSDGKKAVADNDLLELLFMFFLQEIA